MKQIIGRIWEAASRNPARPVLAPLDLTNDAAVIEAARAAVSMLDRRRGKAKAAQAFRDALAEASAA